LAQASCTPAGGPASLSFKAMADVGASRSLCARAGPARTASAAALTMTGGTVERHQAAAVAMAGRELEALEARLLAMVASQQVQHAAELREADKLVGMANRHVEARVDSMEQHQARLEERIAEVAEAVQGLRRSQEAQDERTAYFAAETRERLEQLWESPVRPARELGLEERLRALEAGGARTQALERRLQALEDRRQGELDVPQAPPQPTAKMAESRSPKRPGVAGEAPFASVGDPCGERLAAGDAALLAVQELESLLRSELKAIRKKCNTLQDQMDECTVVSIKDFEQRLQEQEKMVKQMLSATQESSSRLEEHEFRLGVSRTKLEVHDQKISRLEAARWQRGNSSTFGDAERGSSCGTPTSAAPCISLSAVDAAGRPGETPRAARDNASD